jgi:hypothetical protein
LQQERLFLSKKLKSLKVSTSSLLPTSNSQETLPRRRKPSNLMEMLTRAKEEAQLEIRIHRIEMQENGLGDNEFGDDDVDDVDNGSPEETNFIGDEIANMLHDVRSPAHTLECSERHCVRSIVWHCPPKSRALTITVPLFAGVDDSADDPLHNFPTKTQSLEYARKLKEEKRIREEQKEHFAHELMDQQEIILSKNRTAKASMLRDMREKMKEELQAKNALQKQWEDEQREAYIKEKLKANREAKEKEQAEEREKYRIRQIREIKQFQEKKNAEELAMTLEREKMIIARIANQQEVDEIRRMLEEEDRMRFLEERRRVIEQRNEQKQQEILEKNRKLQEITHEKVDRAQARVRLGNFVWHNGQFGFYDEVRKKPVQYIEYEDEYGPYYYDPVSGQQQRRKPNDAPIKHHLADERKAYDAIYGEGAFDIYRADIAHKDYINQYGGYYDDHHQWIPVHGYYDENYEWVEHDGYYNDEGRYIKFAKVQGTLDFMV